MRKSGREEHWQSHFVSACVWREREGGEERERENRFSDDRSTFTVNRFSLFRFARRARPISLFLAFTFVTLENHSHRSLILQIDKVTVSVSSSPLGETWRHQSIENDHQARSSSSTEGDNSWSTTNAKAHLLPPNPALLTTAAAPILLLLLLRVALSIEEEKITQR